LPEGHYVRKKGLKRLKPLNSRTSPLIIRKTKQRFSLNQQNATPAVTGTCHLFRTNPDSAAGINILVDRGKAYGHDPELPFDQFPVQPGRINYLFLTHAHTETIPTEKTDSTLWKDCSIKPLLIFPHFPLEEPKARKALSRALGLLTPKKISPNSCKFAAKK